MIDTERLKELELEIGPDDLGMVLQMFLAEAEKTVAQIATGLDDAEHAGATHFLRSGALNIGLVGIAKASDKAAAVDPADRPDSAGPLQASLDEAVEEIGLLIMTD